MNLEINKKIKKRFKRIGDFNKKRLLKKSYVKNLINNILYNIKREK